MSRQRVNATVDAGTTRSRTTAAARGRRLATAKGRLTTTEGSRGDAAWSAWAARSAESTWPPGSARATRSATPALPSAGAAWATRSGCLLLRHEYEGPLVVGRPPVVDAQRLRLALAHHALNSAHCAGQTAWRGTRLAAWARRGREAAPLSGWRSDRAGRRASACRAASRSSATGTRTSRAGHWCAGEQRLKILAGDRVFEFLTQEPLLDQNVEVRRERARASSTLIQSNGARILLSAKDELRLFFALRRLFPDRQRHAEQHAYDGKRHQQCRHRIAAVGTSPRERVLTS